MEQDYLSEDVINQLKKLSPVYRDLTKEQKEFVDKLIVNDKLRIRYQRNQLCEECWQPNTGFSYCQFCNSKHFQENFKNWTSGNDKIDTLIQDSQFQATHGAGALEWIENDKFYDIEFFAKGGYGTVYKAKWKDGHITSWNLELKKWNRHANDNDKDQEKYKMVALKILNDSQNIDIEFLRKIKLHQTVNDLSSVIRLYGMSKDPETDNYVIVMNFAENGSLRNHLSKNYDDIHWDRKLYLLREISNGLNEIHEKGLIHQNFHSGNVLIGKDYNIYITATDLGLDESESIESGDEHVFGVLPYMAPEVLEGRHCTQESDIYSFGMIAYEILSGYPPYHDKSHNELLAIKIRQGIKLQFENQIPKLLLDLILQCWDTNSKNRPKSKELLSLLQGYENDFCVNHDSEIFKQIGETNEYNNKHIKLSAASSVAFNPQAIYTSRLLHFIKKIPSKQKKRTLDETIEDLVDFTVPDVELDKDDENI